MDTYFGVIALSVILTVFGAYLFNKKSDGFFLFIFLGSLCFGISYSIVKYDNFKEISNEKYEEVIRNKVECDKNTECSKLYKEIIKDNKITNFEYQDLYTILSVVENEIDKKNKIEKEKIVDERLMELKKKL